MVGLASRMMYKYLQSELGMFWVNISYKIEMFNELQNIPCKQIA